MIPALFECQSWSRGLAPIVISLVSPYSMYGLKAYLLNLLVDVVGLKSLSRECEVL